MHWVIFLATELKLDREESLEEKTTKVRKSTRSHKVKDHNSTKQNCLCVYLYTAMEADLELWWKTSGSLVRKSMWRSHSVRRKREEGTEIDMQMKIYTLPITLTWSYAWCTCRNIKAEILTSIAAPARSEPALTYSFQSVENAALNMTSATQGGTSRKRSEVKLLICLYVSSVGEPMGVFYSYWSFALD